MPEGPEVWILSQAINAYYKEVKTVSYGKHLFILDKTENWSFGLTGKVKITHPNELVKINSGWIYGSEDKYINIETEKSKLGVNFMSSSKEDLEKVVEGWIKSKKKLTGLIMDQTNISGIGVAWGSEILFLAGLRPELKACEQNISLLVDSILYIREKIKNIYENELKEKNNEKELLKTFINNWFENVYMIRDMNIYKKGSKIQVLGRSWWV
jgi:formamidopyrimidine-DNA glycosylase